MITYIEKQRTSLLYRALCAFVAFTFAFSIVLPPQAAAQLVPQTILNLPPPGTIVSPSVGYTPAIVAGITIYPDNPFQFDFIIDTGDDNLQGEKLRKESEKLINYFLATLTVPDDEMWVNLSPYEKDRIIADGLGITEMGRDMLAQDYMLKQLTASLMYPEEELGDQFWKRVHKKSQARFGTTEIPANTFNKVWIVPEEAAVYVNGRNVFVSESHLNVMLEEDYLALESNVDSTKHGLGKMTKNDIEAISQEAKEAIREIILPEIEREVNEGENFANLRQIYHSMILATWYKKNLKQSILSKVYVDRNKVEGIDLEDKQIKQKIYNQYIEAFKKGVYNYIREDYDAATQTVIPRKYFSGGLKNVEDVKEGEQLAPSAIAGDRRKQRASSGIGMLLQKVAVKINPKDSKGNVIHPEQSDSLTDNPGEIEAERQDLLGSMHIAFDQHDTTIEYVDELAKKMEDKDVVFVEVGRKFLWVNYEQILNDIGQGNKTPEQALNDSLLLRLLVTTDQAPIFGTHVKALMEALHKAYQATGKKREVVMEQYRNKKLEKRIGKVMQKLQMVSKFLYAGNLEKALATYKEGYDELAAIDIKRDDEYIEIIKDSFREKRGQRALLVRGAAHTKLFIEFKKNIPEIEVTRDFLGKRERNYSFPFGAALLRKLIFQKAGILRDIPIHDLEYVQGLVTDVLYDIAKRHRLKIKALDVRMINKIAKRVNTMDLARKWFDDIKESKIPELKRKQRRNAYDHSFIQWLLSQGLAMPKELAKAFGDAWIVETLNIKDNEDVNQFASSPIAEESSAINENWNPREFMKFSTKDADFILHLGYHIHKSEIPEDIIKIADAVVLETGNILWEEDETAQIRNQKQYTDIVRFLVNHKKPLFYVDVPNSKWIRGHNLEDYLLRLTLMLKLMLASIAPPFLRSSLVWVFLLDEFMQPVRYHRLHNILGPFNAITEFYSDITFRSAVSAKKIVENIVPRIRAEKGRKPAIFIEYGARHSDIKFFIENPGFRESVIAFHRMFNFPFLDKKYINKIGEIRVDKNSSEVKVYNVKDFNRQAASSPVEREDASRKNDIQANAPGGIDFNPNNLNLKEQGQASDIRFTDFPNIQPHMVIGVTPIIVDIVPIVNFPQLLGLADDKSEPYANTDSDSQTISFKLGLVDKYRNKYVRGYAYEEIEV